MGRPEPGETWPSPECERERGSNVKFRRNGLLPTPTGQVSQIPELELRLPMNKTCPLSTCQTVQRLSPDIFILSRIKNNFIKIIKIKVFFTEIMIPLLPSAAVVSDGAGPC